MEQVGAEGELRADEGSSVGYPRVRTAHEQVYEFATTSARRGLVILVAVGLWVTTVLSGLYLSGYMGYIRRYESGRILRFGLRPFQLFFMLAVIGTLFVYYSRVAPPDPDGEPEWSEPEEWDEADYWDENGDPLYPDRSPDRRI
ncbi:hypothetical protein BH10ACT3_BH10ACT3_00900 [soil metagenome]